MAGRIRSSDIDEVKQRVNIVEVVSDYVALKPAGVDSLKGLCPFHDERTPSFHVRPSQGRYHCFGCGEGGDAIAFVQHMDHLSFIETVERLAARVGYQLTYEAGGQPERRGPQRTRLFAANEAATAFYKAQLMMPQAQIARETLLERGFNEDAWAQFAIGFAPQGWNALRDRLRSEGFSDEELIQAGLLSQGSNGVYDRFRGRLMWPIKDTSGQTVGFGARKLFDDDQGPKYLNTPETPIYHKSKVLYGLDQAKRSIARDKRVVIVEGYTDVMACHLAGVTSAVATCGTAFGREHISLLRRVMGDDASAEVIFTFDPDEAGQKAALKAFAEEKRFSAQTYVAMAPEGLDPSDLRQHRGDDALRDMFTNKTPLFAFALRQTVNRFDLNSVEGRAQALRAAAPIVQDIQDPAVRRGYTRELARMVGADLQEVSYALRNVPRNVVSEPAQPGDAREMPPAPAVSIRNLPNTPDVRRERDAVMVMLQMPTAIGEELLQQATAVQFVTPALQSIAEAIAAELSSIHEEGWIERVFHAVPEHASTLARELSIMPLPQRDSLGVRHYGQAVVKALIEHDLLALKREMIARLQRSSDSQDPLFRQLQEQIHMLEQARRSLQAD